MRKENVSLGGDLLYDRCSEVRLHDTLANLM